MVRGLLEEELFEELLAIREAAVVDGDARESQA
jgi:hypothetical protein